MGINEFHYGSTLCRANSKHWGTNGILDLLNGQFHLTLLAGANLFRLQADLGGGFIMMEADFGGRFQYGGGCVGRISI